MLTPTTTISDWRDLQEKTRRLFAEMGYVAEVSRQAILAGRGKKEIDVYVTDPHASYNRIYLVECKFWETRVSQETIHAFKTVMEETGANTGFIVSKVGFQRGAFEAARFTNIHLLTFDELQHAYGNEWYRKQREKLDVQIRRLREHHTLHFDQWNMLGFSNNMHFTTAAHLDRLSYFHHWISNLLLDSSSKWPDSYRGPEPVKVANNPNNPREQVPDWFEFPTVREYFAAIIAAAKRCADEFDAFVREAHDAFNLLPDDDQTTRQLRMLSSLQEELPLRVLKARVTADEFTRIVALTRGHDADTRGSV